MPSTSNCYTGLTGPTSPDAHVTPPADTAEGHRPILLPAKAFEAFPNRQSTGCRILVVEHDRVFDVAEHGRAATPEKAAGQIPATHPPPDPSVDWQAVGRESPSARSGPGDLVARLVGRGNLQHSLTGGDFEGVQRLRSI